MSEESLETTAEASDQTKTASHKPKGWGVLTGTFWAACAFLSPQLLVVPLVPLINSLGVSENTALFIVQAAIQLLTIALLVLVIRAYGLPMSSIGLGKTTASKLGFAVLVFPIYAVVSIVISKVSEKLFPIDMNQEQVLGYAMPQGLELALVFVALVIVTPFVEEMLFRGFLFRPYVQRFGFVGAAVLVSLLFALAHGQWNVGIDVFLLSLLLCYLRYKTNSLWPAITLHAVKNLVAFYLLFIIGVE